MTGESMRLSNRLIKKFQNKQELLEELKKGKSPQQIWNYTAKQMGKFYAVAHHLLEEKRVEEARNAFIFLITLNPTHSEYWLGLGFAEQYLHQYEEAIDAYEMAAIYNMGHPLPYLYLAKCLFAIHDRKSALQAIEIALEYAQDSKEYEPFKREALKAKKTLLS